MQLRICRPLLSKKSREQALRSQMKELTMMTKQRKRLVSRTEIGCLYWITKKRKKEEQKIVSNGRREEQLGQQ